MDALVEELVKGLDQKLPEAARPTEAHQGFARWDEPLNQSAWANFIMLRMSMSLCLISASFDGL